MCEAGRVGFFGGEAPTELVVVVPVFRNEDSLEELARRVAGSLADAAGHRLLFVVDASPDASWSVVVRLAAGDPRIGGLLLRRNLGQHQAVLHGLASLRAEHFAVLDADLQDPPEHLAAMLALARERRTTVFAGRRGEYQGPGRMLTSRLFKRLLERWTGLPRDAGAFLVMPASVAARMLTLHRRTAYLSVLAYKCSDSCIVHLVPRAPRGSGASAYTAFGRVGAAWRAVRCARECHRAGFRGPPSGAM